jgi:1-acyl-sn-glycerol-3-phosphate acyltransferase
MTTPRTKKPAPAAAKKKSAPKRRSMPPPPAEAVALDSRGVDSTPPDTEPPKTAAESPRGRRKRSESSGAHDPAVVAQIRELEAQLDRLIDEASRRDVSSLVADDDEDDDDAETREVELVAEDEADTQNLGASFDPEATVASSDAIPPAARPSGPLPQERGETVFDTARELLSTDFYLRKWGRVAMRGRSEEVDDFGFDPTYDAKYRPLLDFLYTKYFRVETEGVERIPPDGRCVLVSNHSGTLPLDGVMIKTAVKREHPYERDVRWLTEDFIYHFPYLGSAMNRLGAVRACQENAERLLAKEQLVCVFPEGVKGIGKLFAERYRLQRFGRGGFIKLCLRTSTPIVPVAVVGAEETNPMLFRIEYLSKALGLPYVPVTPTFPLFGAAGLMPAPTKWRIMFGEPLDFSAHGAGAADDELLVGKLAERVRAAIQGMLDRAVGARKSVFFG